MARPMAASEDFTHHVQERGCVNSVNVLQAIRPANTGKMQQLTHLDESA